MITSSTCAVNNTTPQWYDHLVGRGEVEICPEVERWMVEAAVGRPWADITLLHLESAPHLRPSIVHLQIGISIADIAPPANACAIGGTCWNIFRACNMAEMH